MSERVVRLLMSAVRNALSTVLQGVALPTLQAAGSLYIVEHIAADWAARNASTNLLQQQQQPVLQTFTPAASSPSAADLDTWFPNEDMSKSGGNAASALRRFCSQVVQVRARHSSLLLLIDDSQHLALHANGGEMELYDALVALQVQLARMDAASEVTESTAVPPSASTAPLPSSLLLVAHGDVPVSPVLSLLRRRASSFVKLQPLQTGYTKEITGVVSAQQHDIASGVWTTIQRMHYKLSESSVHITVPGHSSSTVHQ
jgi:hypothetical protein